MKVLINGLQLGKNNSGVQYYVKHLYTAIEEIQLVNINTQLFTQTNKLQSSTFLIKFFFSLLDLIRLRSLFDRRLFRIITENFYLPNYLREKKINIFHSPNYVLPFFINIPSVVTIHDLITFDFPKLCQKESVIYFRLFIPRSIKRADKIITVSETVKKDIISHFKVPKDKVIIIPLGVSDLFKRTISSKIKPKYFITNKYILFVGNIEPKKNLVRLIKAYHKLVQTKKIPHQLIISGKKGWKYNEVYNIVQLLNLNNKVIFTGYVPENDLPILYSMADLFVFPSLYEGFGIPPLEAMACETPVLAANTGSLPETTGRNCLLVDPYSVNDIAAGIYRLLKDIKLRKEFIVKGKDWAKHFTWERTAQKTIDVYNEIYSEIKRRNI